MKIIRPLPINNALHSKPVTFHCYFYLPTYRHTHHSWKTNNSFRIIMMKLSHYGGARPAGRFGGTCEWRGIATLNATCTSYCCLEFLLAFLDQHEHWSVILTDQCSCWCRLHPYIPTVQATGQWDKTKYLYTWTGISKIRMGLVVLIFMLSDKPMHSNHCDHPY